MTSFGRSSKPRGLHNDLDRLQTSYQDFHDDESDEESPPPAPSFQHTYQGGSGVGGQWHMPTAAATVRSNFFSSPKTPGPSGDSYGNKRHYGGADDSPGGVIIHHVPEESKSRWSHIEDLDSFFKKVYEYHQRHGFKVMMLQVCTINYL